MLVPVLLLSSLAAAPNAVCEGAVPPASARPATAPAVVRGDSVLAALYASGTDYRDFLAAAEARRDQWRANTERAVVAPDALAAARALPGRWRLLVVAVDGCSDSVNTIPYLAALVEGVASLELRIVMPGPGRPVMEAHRTPDGRPATPTVVVLDAAGNEVGCWVERPKALQDQAVAARAGGTLEQFQRGKQGWYDADAGASTVREVVAVLQAAAAGTPRCDAITSPLPRPGGRQ